MREDERTMLPSLLSSFGRCRHCLCGACMPVFVWSTRLRPRVEASGSRVDGLLHDDGDEAIAVIPRHTSSVAASLFADHHPHHHHPCRPHPLLHHCCRRSPATLVTVFLSLAALIVSAFIIRNALLLYVTTRCRARVHCPPSTLLLLVDCCIFTPAVAAAIITVSAPPPQSSPTPPQLLSSLTSSSKLRPLTLLLPPLLTQPPPLLLLPLPPRPSLLLSPTMAASADANADADAAADADADANARRRCRRCSPPPCRRHRRRWRQTPSLPCHRLALVFDAVKGCCCRCHRCH